MAIAIVLAVPTSSIVPVGQTLRMRDLLRGVEGSRCICFEAVLIVRVLVALQECVEV